MPLNEFLEIQIARLKEKQDAAGGKTRLTVQRAPIRLRQRCCAVVPQRGTLTSIQWQRPVEVVASTLEVFVHTFVGTLIFILITIPSLGSQFIREVPNGPRT